MRTNEQPKPIQLELFPDCEPIPRPQPFKTVASYSRQPKVSKAWQELGYAANDGIYDQGGAA